MNAKITKILDYIEKLALTDSEKSELAAHILNDIDPRLENLKPFMEEISESFKEEIRIRWEAEDDSN